ncbi:MAG: hypothetical protein ABS88_02165 [Sphingopyxis sp. SCN 67-31]|nr:MAG: hypothetical protein ABS88_02165 [Sphingopyxis sp. SCN 67-31]
MLDDTFRDIALSISAAVGGPYHPGSLNYPGEPVYDLGGSIIDPGTPYGVDVHVQVDDVTEDMRADADFQERDVRLLILGPDTLDAVPTVSVTAGPFSGQLYSIRSVSRDTLGFAWECRGRAIG